MPTQQAIAAVQKAVAVKISKIYLCSMRIETERLIMRPFEMDDAEELFAMDSLPEVHTYLGKKPFKTLDEVIKNIEWVQSQYQEHGIGRFVVVLKSENKVIGWSGLKFEKEVRPNPYYDIGYRFHPDYWGKGIATETAIAALKFGFEEKKYPEICGAAEAENIASNVILKKIGLKQGESFEFDGAHCHWYSLTREDYLNRT